MRQTFEEMLSDIIRPEVENLGYVFWGLSSPASGKKRVVRIYIDHEGGVTIDQCAQVSRQVGLMLEVEDVIPGAFTLEVSSPGLERPFFRPEQMAAYVGRIVEVVLNEPVGERKKFKGELKGVDGDTFTLALEDDTMDFDWLSVKKATLVHEF
ncbi:ribosome maturation factor RimP [Pseudodesulfovibrio portus]|jgi:ribosome maturation factor RimP|uniref:Ribosome maturation factor RimP n=1 Tax=Pseudodesulfovibrio portus TaxID=231439 RepID=A0ABM8AVA9_9BACT|nr:ribosome maturation factor RimP [Pseudodesulfovibrio portus]BDQ35409.1 ribosome maturation factor RimP [Pseudodesulfovibrio portus]